MHRRGGIYWWRRRLSVSNHKLTVALSLRTADPNTARSIALKLGTAVEDFRMAYGERGQAISHAALQKIFSDAMRWQLERILSDQTGSGVDPEHHRWINRAFAELWRIFARQDSRWTADDDERLAAEEWPQEARLLVSDLWQEHRDKQLVSPSQLDAYRNRFGFEPTASNLDRVRRIILSARSAACAEATKHLGTHPADFDRWVEGALSDGAAFAFEADHAGAPDVRPEASPAAPVSPQPGAPTRPKKLLTDAAEECIEFYLDEQAWGDDSVEQVRTAIRLFDFACGDGVFIDDLKQDHVDAFHKLCKNMPNRWGKSRDELARGLPASVDYAAKLKAEGQGHRVGFSKKTIDKHVTWIQAVLRFADNDGADSGHRPDRSLKFKTDRTRIGAKKESAGKRARDLRSNWTVQEVERLLAAPIWWGCADLDQRFEAGQEIYHDAWYWLGLMYILYGGRSSELAGLPLTDIFENAPTPHFRVDYTDLRGLKNVQSIRSLPMHPELLRLGFVEYVSAMRGLGHKMLFPELHSPKAKSFASTVYRSIFVKWRSWAFPAGTEWRHQARGAVKDKDVHSFRGIASSLMKDAGVPDSVRFDIIGHEGENTTQRIYDNEAALEAKLNALQHVTPLTQHLKAHPLRLRPPERQKFGAKRGRPPKSARKQ